MIYWFDWDEFYTVVYERGVLLVCSQYCTLILPSWWVDDRSYCWSKRSHCGGYQHLKYYHTTQNLKWEHLLSCQHPGHSGGLWRNGCLQGRISALTTALTRRLTWKSTPFSRPSLFSGAALSSDNISKDARSECSATIVNRERKTKIPKYLRCEITIPCFWSWAKKRTCTCGALKVVIIPDPACRASKKNLIVLKIPNRGA